MGGGGAGRVGSGAATVTAPRPRYRGHGTAERGCPGGGDGIPRNGAMGGSTVCCKPRGAPAASLWPAPASIGKRISSRDQCAGASPGKIQKFSYLCLPNTRKSTAPTNIGKRIFGGPMVGENCLTYVCPKFSYLCLEKNSLTYVCHQSLLPILTLGSALPVEVGSTRSSLASQCSLACGTNDQARKLAQIRQNNCLQRCFATHHIRISLSMFGFLKKPR